MTLPNDEDFLMRPVLAGVVRFESLFDGSLDLEHLAMANDALDVKEENERRLHAAQERKIQR